MAQVFKHGATKNPGRWPANWRDQKNPGYAKNKRAAMGRHLVRHDCDELWDESGEPAIFHAAANLLIEADLDERLWEDGK